MKSPNPCLDQVYRALPRLLALYDTDPLSPTCGLGDRTLWAWKLIDFGNATFQGAAHGLARLVAHGLLPEWLSEAAALRRLDAMVRGAGTLCRGNGSLEEAFPHEASFCVTALVACDILTATDLLADRLDDAARTRHLDVVRPLIAFLRRADETHGFISNHLAVAAQALYRWARVTGETSDREGQRLLDRILAGQSGEGWFREYEGADPGYQTLCTTHLAGLHAVRPDLGLLEPLRRSVQCLWHFAHPDGSFGGLYGSRNTRFYHPAGIEALAADVPEAAALAQHMRRAIASHTTITLDAIDEPNLVPLFNDYCWAAATVAARGDDEADVPAVPACGNDTWRRQFPDAGLLIDKTPSHYTIVSWHKGGVCYRFPLDGGAPHVDVGVAARSPRGTLFSTQAYQRDNVLDVEGDTLTVTAALVAMRQALPSPFQFVVLRLLACTVMRWRRFGDWVKKALVRKLITGRTVAPVRNRRTIRLGDDFAIADEWHGDAKGFTRVACEAPFRSIHMASQGYWQRQDDAS